MQDKTTPASKINQFFPITATIWRNQNAEGRIWYNASVERHYRDREGKRQTTTSFSGDELLTAAKLFDLAHTEVSRLRVADREAQADDREPGAEG